MLLSNQPHLNYKLYQVVIIIGFWLYQKKGEKRQQELKSKNEKGKKENRNTLLISYSDGSNFDNKILHQEMSQLDKF